MATHLREDTAAQTAADICASIAGALDSDVATQPLAALWDALTAKGDALALQRRTLERKLGRSRARTAVADAVWDGETGSFGRDVLVATDGNRDASQFKRFFSTVTAAEAQDFGVRREVEQGRAWIKELGRDPAEPLAVKWTPRMTVATDALDKASKERKADMDDLAMHGTGEVLYVEEINLELDKLEGDLKKLFPGQPKRVAAYLAATKPRRGKRGKDDEEGGDAGGEGGGAP